MIAVISDIHANLEALTAVLADAEAWGAHRIICLGDVIGVGPDPCACVDVVMKRCQITVLGDHDAAAFADPEGFNPAAASRSLDTRATRPWSWRCAGEGASPELSCRPALRA